MKRSLFVWSTSLVIVCTLVIGSESSGIQLHERAYHDSSKCSLTAKTESVTVTLSPEANCNVDRTATVTATFNVCENNGCENYDMPHAPSGFKTSHNCCMPVPKADAQNSNGDYAAPYVWTVKEYTNVPISGGCSSNQGTTEVQILSPTACQCLFLAHETE